MSTLRQQAARIRAGEIDPVELVERHLARIDEREEQVRAWVVVDREGALATAQSIRRAVRAGEASNSPLLGAVTAIKDIVDVAGFPTRSGATWTSDQPVRDDAQLVTGLRQAGAILLGKTVTTELACFDPPPTRNPLNLDRTPGGSSSGSAAAVADGMCQLAVGSQTGGSITRPASFCGVVGMKPTFGAVSLKGVAKVSLHLDHPGPIAGCSDDALDALAAMRATTRLVSADSSPQSTPSVGKLRIVRADTCSGQPSSEVARLFDSAMQTLNLERQAELPTFADVHEMHRRLMFADAAHHYARAWELFQDQFGPCIATVIREGQDVTKEQYIEAAQHQIHFRRELLDRAFADADVIATPATATTAPGPETTGDPGFNSPWSYCGFPTLSIPCGKDQNGLPAAIQFIVRPHEEATLRAVGSWATSLLN